MAFITTDDFPASIHDDILQALMQGNETVRTDNIDRAVDEVQAYLNGRYDVATDFAKVGAARNKFLVRLCVTLAVYYIFSAHNPRKLTAVITADFTKAIEDLEKIQAGKLNPVGLTDIPDPDTTDVGVSGNGTSLQWSSDCQLTNDY